MLEVILYISYGVLLIVGGLMIRQLWYARNHFAPASSKEKLGHEVDMPSVSVCIPARNEMHALSECLEKVLASHYDRLEVIVLDDVSGDDTSALIKSFAQEGVRFVAGTTLPSGWLGKNHALQGLLHEASGSYIIFIDVDTRITPDAINNVVRYALSQRAEMVSVLPRREDGWRMSVFFSPLRYFWEVIFHRKTTPAVASSLWLVKKSVLTDTFHGFSELKDAVQPEATIAATLAIKDRYRFLIGTASFGIGYEKKWRSQLVTSTRLLFPQLSLQVSIAIIAVLDLLILLIPSIATVLYCLGIIGAEHIVAIAILALYALIYGLYTHWVWKQGAWLGAILWPLLLIQEVLLICASVYQYKRKTVKWKGRTFLQNR